MKKEGIKNQRKYYLAIIFAVVLVLLPTSQANAVCIAGFFPITDCILTGFSYFVFLMFTIVGNWIAALAGILQWVINLPVYPADGQRIAVIDESWKIMRNFANMFFIIALIMMAFATIFDVIPGATKYNARALFGKFLLTALLINFSLVLGVMVIQGTQVLSNTFLTSIGDMSSRLGQELNPSKLLPDINATTAFQAADNGIFGSLISLVFALVLAVTFLFSLLTATIFAFIRIPIIWALLIVSPIAWILNIFPAGEGMFKKWWSTFIGWNMFLPIFLFFLYFGLYFLQGQDAVMQAIAGSSSTGSILGDAVTSFTFQMVFMYIMAAIFLIGGTITAMKASMFSGTGVVQVAGWARKTALRTTGIAAWQRGGQEKWKEMQQEGYGVGQFRFGGEKAFEREVGRRARMLGTKGALGKGIEAEKERQKPYAHDINKLTDLSTSGSREQRLAARERLAELGALSAKQVLETEKMYGIDREAANKYITGIDYSKFTKEEREKFAKFLTNLEASKKNAMAMIEKDALSEEDIARMGEMFAPAEIKDFLDKGNKKNLITTARARVKLKLEGVGTIDEEIDKAFKKITDDQITEIMGDPSFKNNPDYQTMVQKMNELFSKNPKRLETLVAKSSGGVQENLKPILRSSRINRIKPLATRGQKLTSQIRQAQQELTNINTQFNLIKNYPTSSDYAKLEKERTAKENEIKSLQDKRIKVGEQVTNITSGTPTMP